MGSAAVTAEHTATRSAAIPLAALFVAMLSIQCGAAYAKSLFPAVGAQGVTALRLGLSAVILLPILRPWRARLSRRHMPALLAYGVSLGLMNLTFYMALNRIPLGIAVALEFTGPLTLAVISSRRRSDFAWIALAVVGLLLLLPIGKMARPLDPLGVLYALGAGVGWAMYAVFGKRAGVEHGAAATSIGTAIGALVVVPVGLAHTGPMLLTLPILLSGVAVAIFSSALPCTLEMVSLTHLPARVYGTLTSAEPALGAVAGLVFLHEKLTPLQVVAIAAIVLASVGTALTLQPAPKPQDKGLPTE